MPLGGGAAGDIGGAVTVLKTNPAQLDQDLRTALGMEFSFSPHPMWVFDQHSLAFLAVNEAAVHQYGYSREEFLAMTILDIRPSEDVPQVLRNALRPHTVNGKHERWRHRTRKGEVMYVEIAGVSLIFENRLAQLIMVERCLRAVSAH